MEYETCNSIKENIKIHNLFGEGKYLLAHTHDVNDQIGYESKTVLPSDRDIILPLLCNIARDISEGVLNVECDKTIENATIECPRQNILCDVGGDDKTSIIILHSEE